jgi:disease resistance protein RPM1
VNRNYVRRLKNYRIYDVTRLLALNKAKEECFGKVYNASATGVFSAEGACCISVQGENLEQLRRYGATHLCALHVSEKYIHMDLWKSILASLNLLSMLDLQATYQKAAQ